jgi:hypothetical protein
MSVIVVLRITGNPADLEAYAAGPGGEVMKRVAERAKAAGAIRHRFAAGDNEVVVIDEWPDEQTFGAFFANEHEIADVMRDGGAKSEPQVTMYRRMSTPDQF